jgi:ABC-2 type transport system ATP-binding protein
MAEVLLQVRELTRHYGRFTALAGVSFDVFEGEMFGLLGPNGAGKTSLLTILACLADPSGGEARLAGELLGKQALFCKPLIGIGTQDLAVYPDLTARENLRFFGKLYGLGGAELRKREDEVLERIGLRDRAEDRAGTFSGGMKRRLNLGVAIMHRPRLLLLDEPTTGVDPQSRNHIFEHVRELNASGTTVVYTSHYMEEVQALCPRLAILDAGRIVACDRLAGLLDRLPGIVRVVLETPADGGRIDWTSVAHVETSTCLDALVTLETHKPGVTAAAAVRAALEAGVAIRELQTETPTLESVFLKLTHRALRD